MASELLNAIEKQYSIKALQNILANLENVNLKNSRGETALAAVIRLCTDGRPRKGVDFQEFESYIVKAVQLFIDAGVDVNLKNLDGQSVIEALMTSNYRGEKLLEILEILIEAGADVNSSNRIHQTALHLAAKDQFNQIEFIRFLLQRGVNVDYRDYYGFTALHCAVEKGNKEVVQCLIDAGADVSLKNRGGETALYLAAKNNNPNQVDFIRFLLQRGADVNSQDSNGSTALQYAVRNKNKEVIQFLIDVGADVNLKDKKGQSVIEALITSRYRGVQLMLEILEVLIKAGADVNSRNKYGETALHLAAKEQYNQVDFIRNLLKHGADVDSQDVFQFTALQYAVQKQNKEVVACLIDAGSDVNLKNKNGQTALHLAADNYYPNQVDFIRFLLQRGADVNSQDSNGSTALQYAVQNKNKEVVQCLLDAGADVNSKIVFDETALHVAAKDESTNIDCIRLLLQRGADINSQNCHGSTALHCAVEKGNKEVIKCLIEAGTDVNLKNKDGQTALHLAANDNNPNQVGFIRLLLQRGADVNSQDSNGWTALHFAARYKNKEVVQFLWNAGADINKTTLNGETPLHLAAKTINVDLIKYLITRGADINAKDGETGKTSLHNLMNRGFEGDKLLDALEVLLSAGADVNAVELSQNYTPLHYFILSHFNNNTNYFDLKIFEPFFRILNIFIKYRADFKIKNLRDETPMEIFLKNCYRYKNFNYPMVLLETFIKYGIMDIESLFTSGWDFNETIVHKACYSLNYKMIKFLVNYGADIEVVNYQMETPLMKIINGLTDAEDSRDDCKILDYFLSLNPDVDVITDEGHILNYHSSYYPKFVWKALIEHIAKKQSTGYLLHVDIAQTISYDTYYGYQSYLDKCTEELKSLQDLKFPWVNFYDILMDSKKKLDCYAKNKELVQEFNELSLAQTYPIYGPHIVKRFSKAVKKQEVKEKSAVILSSCLPCHMDPSHLVIKKIISYLKGKHLKYLCEPESEELKKKLKMEEFKISFDKYVGSYYKI